MTGTLVLEPPVTHRNGYELPREEVMRQARRRVRKLADRGLSTAAIQTKLDLALLNRTERDLVWLIVTHEVDRARRDRPFT